MMRFGLSAETARSLLDYDPDTGVFRWKLRPVEMFNNEKGRASRECKRWNGCFAGKVAGTLNNGYVSIGILGIIYQAHRLAFLIMTGEWPADEIDHKNLDRSDNRWKNLRPASSSQNAANTRPYRNNTSGFKGVSWNKRSKKWQSRIKKDGHTRTIGFFDDPNDAHAAYLDAAQKIHGEFARAA